jgi:hypothetical protein
LIALRTYPALKTTLRFGLGLLFVETKSDLLKASLSFF